MDIQSELEEGQIDYEIKTELRLSREESNSGENKLQQIQLKESFIATVATTCRHFSGITATRIENECVFSLAGRVFSSLRNLISTNSINSVIIIAKTSLHLVRWKCLRLLTSLVIISR